MKTMCSPRLSPQWFCGNSCTWAHDVRYIYIYVYIHIYIIYIYIYIYTYIYDASRYRGLKSH